MKRHFQFNCRVSSVLASSDDDWVIEFQNGKVQHFSFVVFCTGLVSVKPKMIEIPGMNDFVWNGGEVIHSSERYSDAFFHGQRVMVIGNGKSAADAITSAVEVAKKKNDPAPFQVARRQIWYIPRYLFCGRCSTNGSYILDGERSSFRGTTNTVGFSLAWRISCFRPSSFFSGDSLR